jgi:hypothetical protein
MASYNIQQSAPVQEATSGFKEPQLPRRSNRFKSMPYVVYSNSKREVSGQELAMLFAAAKEPYMSNGSLQKASYYAHCKSSLYRPVLGRLSWPQSGREVLSSLDSRLPSSLNLMKAAYYMRC